MLDGILWNLRFIKRYRDRRLALQQWRNGTNHYYISLPWWNVSAFRIYWLFVRGIHQSAVDSLKTSDMELWCSFDYRPNKLLDKLSSCTWFETPWCSWDGTVMHQQSGIIVLQPDATKLRWRHNGQDSVSNHQHHHCLLNRLFGCRSMKTSKLRVTGLCAGNSPGTGEFPAQMASNAENVSIWWRHHGAILNNVWVHWNTKAVKLTTLWSLHLRSTPRPLFDSFKYASIQWTRFI